jgi:hypothetical protein
MINWLELQLQVSWLMLRGMTGRPMIVETSEMSCFNIHLEG